MVKGFFSKFTLFYKLFIYYCAFDYNIQYVHSYLCAMNF